jgi:hypothetical protein
MEDIQQHAATKRFVGEVTVRRHVQCEHKGRKADKHPCSICAIESTATLSEVRLQAVERHHKTRNVEGVLGEDTLTVEGDNSGAMTQVQDEGIIAHAHLEVGDQFV